MQTRSRPWFRRRSFAPTETGFRSVLQLSADSQWVDGHFPGNPILPAVALIECLSSAVADWNRHTGDSLAVVSLSRVRFRLVVKGECRILIVVERGSTTDAWTWSIYRVDESGSEERPLVAGGGMTLAPTEPEKRTS